MVSEAVTRTTWFSVTQPELITFSALPEITTAVLVKGQWVDTSYEYATHHRYLPAKGEVTITFTPEPPKP